MRQKQWLYIFMKKEIHFFSLHYLKKALIFMILMRNVIITSPPILIFKNVSCIGTYIQFWTV